MDLPPPLFRHQQHHHIRYGNVHPPEFTHPPYSHHLPPPPQPLPPHICLPPPPPPPPRSPPRDNFQPILRTRFNFSPPQPPIERPYRERPYHHEFEPLSKPYFNRDLLPPPPPPPPGQENIPFRNIHDYPERNPIFKDEIFRRGCGDNYLHELPENWDRNLQLGERELRIRVHDKRRLGSDMSDRCHELDERDCDMRRLGSSMRGHELYDIRGYDERRWDSRTSNRRSCELYSEEDYDKRRLVYGSNSGVLLRLGNKEPEFMQDNMRLGRFAGRLGRRVHNEEFIRSNKKRKLQKKNALHRIPVGKDCSKHSGPPKNQHFKKNLSSGISGCKEKEGFQQLQTRIADKKEREQSPMELAISFKSNALVAKAILAPSGPAVRSVIDSSNVNNKTVYNMSDSPSAKSSNGVVKTHCLTHGLDLRSESHRTSIEVLDEASVSGSGFVGVDGAISFGEKAIKNEPPRCMNLQSSTVVGSSKKKAKRLRKKKAARKKLLHKLSMQKEKESGNMVDANNNFKSPAAAPELNSDTTLSKGNFSSAIVGVVPDTILFPSLVGKVYEEGEIESDSDKSFPPNLKRKRHSLTTLTASSHAANNVINGCSGHVENSVTTTGEGDNVCQLGNDGVGGHAHETLLANESTGHGDSLYFNQHEKNVNKFVENGASVLHTEKRAIWSIDQYTRLRTDEYLSEFHESDSSLESDSRLLQRPKCVISSDVGSGYANSEELHPNQVNTPQVPVHAVEVRSSDGVVRDCSNVNIGIPTSSDLPSVDRKRIVAQVEVSFPDALVEKSSTDVDSVEGSPKAISNVETCSHMDYSSKIIRKRKARSAPEGVYSSSTNVLVGTVRSIGGEVARLLSIPDVEVDLLVENDTCNEDDFFNKELSEVEDTTLEVDSGANGLCFNYRKKRKGSCPRSNLLSLSEDNPVAGGVTSDCSGLVLRSVKAEWGAERREDSPSGSTSTTECAISDMEDKVVSENFYVADLDKNLSDVNKLHTNGDQAVIANSLSSCADRNGVGAPNSRKDLLASGFDMGSCMSSPEELLFYSDLSFSRNVACQSENGEFMNKAAAENSQTNGELSPSLLEDSSKMVKKLNFAHGKLTTSKNQPTVPKASPGHQPSNLSNSRKFQYTHVTKSRTWCRPGNSVTVTEPKSQPSFLPPSQGTKLARNMQSSYIRKGNSLVRNPSPTGATRTGFHGSGCSVYRLTTCTDNLKNSQASDSKIDDVNAPTLLRIKEATSAIPKEPPLNHTGKASDCSACNTGDSLSVGDPPRNSGLDETIKSSAVPECRTDPVSNPDGQSKLEGNLEKKILYVKRRSNQLIAASSSIDTSIPGADKTQASLSDGYYKSKKNQLVRASSENHVKKEDANVNLLRLAPHTNLPRTSKRPVSGFAKSCRHSKFSSVWKLHDKQSSEKHKNSVVPRKVWPHLFPWKRATYLRNFMHALGTKPNSSSLSTTSQKLLLSRKRGAIYTRSTHGYSLRMSKVLSVGASSLKWSKSIERNSKMANEEATRAVAAAEKKKKEETGAVPIATRSRNHVSRKLVLSVKLLSGERIFRIGSERYKMDATRRTLHRITAEKEPPSSAVLQSEKKVKRSYVPRRLLICNEEYVRIGNGNQLVRDPKKRTRVLASEKVRWSLRTARLRLARKKKYCQFFTRYGKCNKDDGKCLYIHDPSKIAVCTKFLSGSCSNLDCKLTHKVIPERMQDCSYFLKGSCSNENCPYRHVNVNPDWPVCRNFLRGYCADGNECRKKHTYICSDFESTGICPRASTCKLHHPKQKVEAKPESEQKKIVRGRYFDGGLIGVADCTTPEKLSAKGKNDLGCHEGNFPDYISLVVSDDEVDPTLESEGVLSDMEISDDDELVQPSLVMNRDRV
ncbi:hypothetical protein ABFX02_03G096800 [Erythranthe guttata]